MRRIFLTGIGGDVACAIIRCIFDKCQGDELYGIDIREYTPYMKLFKHVEIAPRYTDSIYWDYIKAFVLNHEITHFIPTTEPEILIMNEHRVFFENNNIKLLLNNEKVLDICTSKYKTSKYLHDIGIDVPRTFKAEEYSGELGYPFILKADFGRGSSSLKIINTEADWMEASKKNMVCQQLIGVKDKEYTIGVFSNGHDVHSITMRRELGLGGMSIYVECCDIPEITEIARKVAKALQLYGSINIQLREENNKYYIFEINPRLSSTTGFRHLMGFTDVIWWLQTIDDEEIYPFYSDAKGKIGVKLTEDVIVN